MVGRHAEPDGLGQLVAVGSLGLGEDVIAVVQAGEGEGGAVRALDDLNGHQLAVGQHLLEQELRAGPGLLAGFILLVDLHLIGEHDHGVLVGLALILDGLARLIEVRVVAVGQVGRVEVALHTQVRVRQQLSLEGQLHRCAVQLVVGYPLAVSPGPGQRLGKALVRLGSAVGQGRRGHRLALRVLHGHGEICGRAKGGLAVDAGPQRIVEGDVVLHIVGHVVRQLGRQHEGHVVADVIVGAVLGLALALTVGIVDVLDLLFKLRRGGGLVFQLASQAALVQVLFKGDLAGGHVAGQVLQGLGALGVGSVPGALHVPHHRMIRGDGELDRVRAHEFIALGHLRLGEDVVAVVQASEGEYGVRGQGHILGDDLVALALDLLLQRELRAFQRGIAVCVHLVDHQLVGEDDDGVLLGTVLILDGLALLVEVRVVAVGQVTGVDVALVADVRARQ